MGLKGGGNDEGRSATAPLPERVRVADYVDIKGGGNEDSRRACDNVGRQRDGASHPRGPSTMLVASATAPLP